tara:strand:+ start:653 stop:1045 length:393 start_codon:yes stop_codon:yes gene_type:complete
MKKHFSITALTCSALLALTNPVNANTYKVGDVFYCESESGAFVEERSDWNFGRWAPFKFKFKIESLKLIKFGSSGWFDSMEHEIKHLSIIREALAAGDDYGKLFLLNGRFNYSNTSFDQLFMMTGTCDKF